MEHQKLSLRCGWIVAIVVWAVAPLTARAAAKPDGQYRECVDGVAWTYVIANGRASVGGSTSSQSISLHTQGAVTIPSTLGGCPVTGIGEGAFRDCGGLTSVTIPEGVTSIGVAAFYDCSGLTEVTIPTSVTSIGVAAFWDCKMLEAVTIPAGVSNIASSTFIGCRELTEVTIPAGVTNIGATAFCGCSGLTEVTIPTSVTSIEEAAFSDCSGLTEVTISEGVTCIGVGVFGNCSRLGSVTIPASVTNIGMGAFGGCMTKIAVADGNRHYSVREKLLCDKNGTTVVSCPGGLTEATIPPGVTSIGDYAFFACDNLASVTIPEGVTSIGNDAFSVCRELTAVTLPASVTNIGKRAFAGCTEMTEIAVADGNRHYSVREKLLYDKGGTTVVCCPGELPVMTIPAGVTSIGKGAFANSGLKAVTIPEGVTSIGEDAFDFCRMLTEVTIPASVTNIGECAFANSGLKAVMFEGKPPKGVKDAWIEKNVLIRYPARQEGEWLPVLEECGFGKREAVK